MKRRQWGILLTSLLIGCSTYNYYLVTPSVHDAVMQDLHVLASRAQRYYLTPFMLGGGSGTFLGITSISQLTLYPTNNNGSFRVVDVKPSELVLEGTGVERDGRTSFAALMAVHEYEANVISDRMLSPAGVQATKSQPETLLINHRLADEKFFDNCNGLVSDLQHIADRAREYYRRPRNLCGGGGSFAHLTSIDDITPLPITAYGTYYLEEVAESLIVLRGRGVTTDRAGNLLQIRMQVTNDGMTVIRDTTTPVVAYEKPFLAKYTHEIGERRESQHGALLSELLSLAARAQQYYRRPASLGGGNGSFDNLKSITPIASKPDRDVGTFDVLKSEEQKLILQGTGREQLFQGVPLMIKVLVTADSTIVFYDTMRPCR